MGVFETARPSKTSVRTMRILISIHKRCYHNVVLCIRGKGGTQPPSSPTQLTTQLTHCCRHRVVFRCVLLSMAVAVLLLRGGCFRFLTCARFVLPPSLCIARLLVFFGSIRCRVLHACRSFGSRSVIPTSCVDVFPWIRSWDLKRNSLNCGCTLAGVKHLAQECCI